MRKINEFEIFFGIQRILQDTVLNIRKPTLEESKKLMKLYVDYKDKKGIKKIIGCYLLDDKLKFYKYEEGKYKKVSKPYFNTTEDMTNNRAKIMSQLSRGEIQEIKSTLELIENYLLDFELDNIKNLRQGTLNQLSELANRFVQPYIKDGVVPDGEFTVGNTLNGLDFIYKTQNFELVINWNSEGLNPNNLGEFSSKEKNNLCYIYINQVIYYVLNTILVESEIKSLKDVKKIMGDLSHKKMEIKEQLNSMYQLINSYVDSKEFNEDSLIHLNLLFKKLLKFL